jgi:hypothetical protein
MGLEEVLAFVRTGDPDTWDLIIREMNLTRKRRDEGAARCLTVGTRARFVPPPPGQPLEGRIVRVGRSRVTLLVVSKESGGLGRISVPAGMVVSGK